MSGDGGKGQAASGAVAGGVRLGLLPLLVLALGFAITFAAWRDASRSAVETLSTEFRFDADRVKDRLELTLDAHVSVLRGVKGLFDASEDVSRAEFRHYVASLELGRRSPGILGVGFSRLIPAQERARHEQAIRAEGYPDYRVRPEGPRDPYSAIVYLEPFSGRNLRAFGYDMLSEPVRRAAMERAVESHGATMTGKVTLVQETERDVQAGFLMYVPVYRHGADLASPAMRRANLVGWAYSPVRMADFMRAILDESDFDNLRGRVDVRVYDGDRASAASLMFDSGKDPGAGAGARFSATLPLDFGGHRWILEMTSRPFFEAGLHQEKSHVVALSGVMISLLLAALLRVMVASRLRDAQALAKIDRSNRELAASEETFRVLFETVPIGVAYHDAAGRFLMANPAAERILGASLDELRSRPLTDPAWQARREDGSPVEVDDLPVSRALRQREMISDAVLELVSPHGGRRIWLRVIAVPIAGNANQAGAYTAFEDITEKKRTDVELDKYRRSLEILVAERTRQLETANAALEAQRMEVEDLFNHAPVGYHSLDAEGRIVRVNDTELAWLGYAREEVIGHPVAEFFTEASRLSFASRFARFKETGKIHGLEFDMVRKDGSLLPVLVDATLVRDAEGNYVASRSNVYDNTERKERQRQIDILNVALARRAEEAEAASRAKGIFLANMSHEFRTPMNGIMGMTYLLQTAIKDPVQLDRLRVIGESAKHLLGILNNVLDISHLESGRVRLEERDFSLPALLEAGLDEIRSGAEAKGLKVLGDIEPGLQAIPLRGDTGRLAQVLRNFLNNAVKFTQAGGITLRVRKLDESPADLLVRFEIQDSGIGISAEDQTRLFRSFEQVDGSSTREYGGTGLGLAINSQIVQLMGGSIGVDSQEGVGSTFWFVLRFDKSAQPAAPAPHLPPAG